MTLRRDRVRMWALWSTLMFTAVAQVRAQDSAFVSGVGDTTVATGPAYVLDTTQTLSERLTELFHQYYKDSSASICYDIALEYLILQRRPYALTYLDKSLTTDPTNMDVQFARAELLLAMDRRRSAYEGYLKVLRDYKAEAYKDRIAARFSSAFSISPLTTSSFDDIDPSFSPDGSRIVFQSNRNGNWDVYTLVVSQGEASVTRLTTDASADENPAYSPDGRFITFSSTREDKTGKRYPIREVYYMDNSGKNQKKITTSYGADNWNPVFVDTQSVVFASDRLDFSNNPFWDKASGIYSIEKDGNFLFKIFGDEQSFYTDPHMLPGGNQIVFAGKKSEANYEIFMGAADGKEAPVNLTNSKGNDFQPNMSRDGTFVCFTTNRDGNYEIYRMQSDGHEPTRITVDDKDDLFPHFSPDGTRIVFCSNRNGNFQIFLAALEESGSKSVPDLIAILEKKLSTAAD